MIEIATDPPAHCHAASHADGNLDRASMSEFEIALEIDADLAGRDDGRLSDHETAELTVRTRRAAPPETHNITERACHDPRYREFAEQSRAATRRMSNDVGATRKGTKGAMQNVANSTHDKMGRRSISDP